MGKNGEQSPAMESERALFDGQVTGLAVTFYRNERPPCGLLGLLDWRFQGWISHYIRNGVITGEVGECVYLPFERNGSVYHLVLAGAGESEAPGARGPVPLDTIHALRKNLTSLKISKLGISKYDFGDVSSDFFSKHLKGVSLWIAP